MVPSLWLRPWIWLKIWKIYQIIKKSKKIFLFQLPKMYTCFQHKNEGGKMSDIKNKFTVLALLDNVSNLYWTPCMILINNLLYLWYKWAKTGKRMKPIRIYWCHPITWDRVRLPTYCLPQLKLQLGHYVKSEQEHKWLKVDLESTHRDRSNTNVCKTWSRHLENKLNT